MGYIPQNGLSHDIFGENSDPSPHFQLHEIKSELEILPRQGGIIAIYEH